MDHRGGLIRLLLIFVLGVSAALPHPLVVERAPGEKGAEREASCALRTTGWGLRPRPRRMEEPQPLDVEHYEVQITLFPEARRIEGRVAIRGRVRIPQAGAPVTGSVDRIRIDLAQNLTVRRVLWDDAPVPFTHEGDRVHILLPVGLSSGESFHIAMEYGGNPVPLGWFPSGMFFTEHAGFPVVATLSQPHGAPTWWPCVDDPADKATADIAVTVPPGYVVASNGVLEAVRLHPDGSRTYLWRERYPIATYLVSIAATNFVEFSDVYRALDGTTMPLVYFVYPEHRGRAERAFSVTRDALRVFASLFGEYPFLAEKYGMAEFPWSGAMEHQTMTSIGPSVLTNTDVIVHEAAHQWWGNMVTPRTWNEIWLSEGFAAYGEVLFRERAYGEDPAELMRRRDDGAADGRLRGTVYAEDAEDPFDDIPAIYTKGAWVLHMLRYLFRLSASGSGDDRFFAALREYGRRFAYANASTSDLVRVVSEFYGESLEWFFEQWVYAPKRPIYAIAWSVIPEGSGFRLRLRVRQKQTHAVVRRDPALPPIYIMPLEFTLFYADGTKEVVRVWNRAREEEFSVLLKRPPVRVVFDERGWILKEVVEDVGIRGRGELRVRPSEIRAEGGGCGSG